MFGLQGCRSRAVSALGSCCSCPFWWLSAGPGGCAGGMAELITFLCSRDSKSAQRDKQAGSQPQQPPTSPASQSRGENEEGKDQQGRRGLSFKCLRSLRSKLREDDWRRPQGPGLEPGSQVSSRGWWLAQSLISAHETEPCSPYRNQRRRKSHWSCWRQSRLMSPASTSLTR